MKKIALIYGCTVVVFALIVVFLHSKNSRFSIQVAGNGILYKVDRKTGKMWMITGVKQFPVSEYQAVPLSSIQPTLEERAIDLVKGSHVFGPSATAEEVIKST